MNDSFLIFTKCCHFLSNYKVDNSSAAFSVCPIKGCFKSNMSISWIKLKMYVLTNKSRRFTQWRSQVLSEIFVALNCESRTVAVTKSLHKGSQGFLVEVIEVWFSSYNVMMNTSLAKKQKYGKCTFKLLQIKL